MSKAPKPVFVCQECGSQASKWLGRCPDCEAWNSFVEERPVETRRAVGWAAAIATRCRAGRGGPALRRRRASATRRGSPPASTSSIACSAAASCRARWCCSAASRASASRRCCCRRRPTSPAAHGPVLYASGEESEHQVKARGERLGVGDAPLYPAGRDLRRAHPRGGRRGVRPRAARRRLDPDGVLAQVPVGAGQHRPGARGGDAVPVRRQGPRPADLSRRPRHQGRQPRRSQGARARRRHRALFRGRAAPLASRGAGRSRTASAR